MADAPWRCSQCGTINEPVANACRTCGRWPSMFDLENSTIEQGAPVEEADDVYAAETLEVERSAPELGEPEPVKPADEAELPPEFEPDEADGEGNRPRRRWQRSARLIVPIGVGLYILISALVNRGG